MLLENGVYRAVVQDISVHLRGENERLTGSFRLECEGKELVHKEWLELNDGSISDKTIKRLRECFPKWDGSIETLEQGFCVQGVEVQVTVENEQDRQDPAKWWTRTKFMDPPGGTSGGTAALPDKVSRATLVGKYGSRFRALAHSTGSTGSPQAGSGQAGGTPARTEVSRLRADATPGQGGQRTAGGSQKAEGEIEHQGSKGSEETMGPPPMPSRPPVKTPAISTLEECWAALCKKYPDEFREQVGDRWFKLLEQVGEGKDQTDFGPEDWGRVMGAIALPF